jgi:hypothetical protein
MRNERRTSGSGMGAAETSAGDRATAPPPHFHAAGGHPAREAAARLVRGTAFVFSRRQGSARSCFASSAAPRQSLPTRR